MNHAVVEQVDIPTYVPALQHFNLLHNFSHGISEPFSDPMMELVQWNPIWDLERCPD